MDYRKAIVALDTIRKTCEKILAGVSYQPGNTGKVKFIESQFKELLPYFETLLEGVEVPQMPEEEKRRYLREIQRLKDNIREQRDLLYKVSSAADVGDLY